MNWYKNVKVAQIWNVSDYGEFANEFESDLQSLYELEYKWSMINQRPFKGLEQRRQNISSNLRNNLNVVAVEVKNVLLGVLNNWLRGHAILDPESWARARVDDMTDFYSIGDIFDSMLNEHMEYTENKSVIHSPQRHRAMENSSMRAMLQFAMKNTDVMPYFTNALDDSLVGYRNLLQSDLDDDGLEEFSENHNKVFKTEDEAELYIENISIDDIDIESIVYFEDAGEFGEFISGAGNPIEILVEFYQNTVFPIWYAHWKEKGIDKTRFNIEKINAELESSNPDNTQKFMAAINIALNAAHQTGAMTQYIEQDTGAGNLGGILEDLSAGSFVPEWDEELREVGVQV